MKLTQYVVGLESKIFFVFFSVSPSLFQWMSRVNSHMPLFLLVRHSVRKGGMNVFYNLPSESYRAFFLLLLNFYKLLLELIGFLNKNLKRKTEFPAKR